MNLTDYQKEKFSVIFGVCVSIVTYLQLEAPNINPYIAPVVGVIFVLYLLEIIQTTLESIINSMLTMVPKGIAFVLMFALFITPGFILIDNLNLNEAESDTITLPIVEKVMLVNIDYITKGGIFGGTKTILEFDNGIVLESMDKVHTRGSYYELIYFDDGRVEVYKMGEFEPEDVKPLPGPTKDQMKVVLAFCVALALMWSFISNNFFRTGAF